MMGFLYVAVAVLSLLSVGQSAPVTDCESLVRPLEIQGRDKLLGKWMYIAESTNVTGSKLLTKMAVESSWGRITAANESDAIDHYQAQKMFGQCFTLRTKLTLRNSTLSMVRPYTASANLLNTSCTDCLVLFSKLTTGRGVYSGVQLQSRRGKLSDAELQEFMKQVECLNLPSPAILDPEKGFCPDEFPSQETETIDLTDFMNDMGSEIVNLFDKIMSSGDGLETLIKLISSSDISDFKKN
ncbi:uncharacterized protein LOC111231542 isoform X1 [Seriola dumerili]|uniref:uncharacterized protein LOC111231542 isoform X1 n=1 Tax=Seriola dumerili TaxID=41447 RepID=UPI000BBE2B15|nr:uncharacterized protein LOC111231542 isoform X1 [Seriola dumerili]